MSLSHRSGYALYGALVVTLSAGLLSAEGLDMTVEQTGCQGLDQDRLERLIATEIRNTFGSSSPALALSVTIECSDDGIDIGIFDRLSGERLTKSFPTFSPDEEEPERTLALAVTQLLALSNEEPVEPGSPRGAEPDEQPADSGAGGVEGGGDGIVGRRIEISVLGGVRFRALGELLPTLHVSLQGGGELVGDLILFGLAGFEYGRAEREIGHVNAYSVWMGLGICQRWPISNLLTFEVGAALSGGYVMLKGATKVDQDIAGYADGATGDFGVFFGPLFEIGSLLIAFDVEAGYTIENPVGTVDDEDDVTIGGFWIGAVIKLGPIINNTQ